MNHANAISLNPIADQTNRGRSGRSSEDIPVLASLGTSLFTGNKKSANATATTVSTPAKTEPQAKVNGTRTSAQEVKLLPIPGKRPSEASEHSTLAFAMKLLEENIGKAGEKASVLLEKTPENPSPGTQNRQEQSEQSTEGQHVSAKPHP